MNFDPVKYVAETNSRYGAAAIAADLLWIVLTFCSLVLVIGMLGWLGFGLGLAIPPMGEDLNWISMLQSNVGANVARTFWATDHRNPLSPWWYIATHDFILNQMNGLLWLRYAMALLLGVSCYVMILSVAGRTARALALMAAMTISVWMANRYFDQIFWNFQGALAVSLLSVAAFSCSQRSTTQARLLYALSLVGWLIALATYTIQSGAILAMMYIAFRRADGRGHAKWPVRLAYGFYAAVRETLPHWILFLLFLLIWQTTVNPGAVPAFQLQPDFSRLLQSVREGLWPSDLVLFGEILLNSPYVVLYSICGFLFALGSYALWTRLKFQSDRKLQIANVSNAFDVLVIAACLVAPTVAIEAGSSAWAPGARWPMVYQFSTPVFFVAAFTLVSTLVKRPNWVARRLWLTAVSILFGVGVAFSLSHNRLQNDFARYETNVRQTLDGIVAEEFLLGRNFPLQFLLMIPEGARWLSQDILSPTISKVWFPGQNIEFRLIARDPPLHDAFNDWWRVRFNDDSEGIDNAKVLGGRVPYANIRVVQFDKLGNATRPGILRREDLTSWLADWKRTAPVELTAKTSLTCPLKWSAEQRYVGSGMDSAERDPAGRPFRWTIARVATLVMPKICRKPHRIRVHLISALSERNLTGLRLRYNGVRLTPQLARSSDTITYEADVPETAPENPSIRLTLEVPKLDHLPEARRSFGVAVHMVELISEAPDNNGLR